jgi:NAD-dependent DNA ligase
MTQAEAQKRIVALRSEVAYHDERYHQAGAT